MRVLVGRIGMLSMAALVFVTIFALGGKML